MRQNTPVPQPKLLAGTLPAHQDKRAISGSSAPKMPTFLVIGAAKAGTTSLYAYLKQHPDIYMSPVKEPKFFATDEGRDVEIIYNGERRVGTGYINNLARYQALFRDSHAEKARGEASALYLYKPEAVHRIKTYLPDVQLIAILRHPVARAYSSFMHLTREGLEPYDDFAEALRAEPGRIKEGWAPLYHYRSRGFYYEQLERYYEVFSHDQIHVYLYDDLQKDAVAVMQSVFEALGVDNSFVPDTQTKYNPSGVPKNKLLHRLYTFLIGTTRSNFKELGKRALPKPLRGNVKRQVLKTLRETNLEKLKLSPEVRNELLQSYREDITKLQTLIGRDLSHWL